MIQFRHLPVEFQSTPHSMNEANEADEILPEINQLVSIHASLNE